MSRDFRIPRLIPEPESERFLALAQHFCPATRLKPFDLWQNLRVYFRVAVASNDVGVPNIDKIFFAFHYTWDIPGPEQIKQRYPWWSDAIIRARHKAFVDHETKWGPGDVELVEFSIRRVKTSASPDSLELRDFNVHRLAYRSGATPEGVITRLLKWEWDKLGRNIVRYSGGNPKLHLLERVGDRLVLCIDSYHHSFHEPGAEGAKREKWPRVVIPTVRYFDDALWDHFQVVAKNRNFISWENT